MPPLTLTVTEAQAGRTVKDLLRRELGLSAARIGALKRREGALTLNGSRVFTSAAVRAGDRLAAAVELTETPNLARPVKMDLSVLYEDEYLLLLDKPAFLLAVPSPLSPGEPTLANAMAWRLGGDAAYHPVNRLDRGTTGLMVVAKSGYVHDLLRRKLHSGDFLRQYLAVCMGAPPQSEGTVDLPIGRAPGSAIQRRTDPDGQSARTDYRVLEAKDGLSLVELTPRTGRTHQLRVHMAALGCPLAGDWLYGEEDRNLIARPALHAARVTLTHPLTGARLDVAAPLPEDMKLLWERHVCPN